MLVPYESFLSSEIFRLQGPQGKSFFIHGGLLSGRSEGLAIHVNGGMLESTSKEILIEAVDGDIDDDTVMRFVEYAYTGDYTVPGPDVVLTSEDVGTQDGDVDAKMDATGCNGHVENGQELASESHMYTEPVYGIEQYIASEVEFQPEPSRYDCVKGEYSGKLGKNKNKKRSKNFWIMEEPEDRILEAKPSESKRSVRWKRFCEKATPKPAEQWQPQSRNDDSEDFTNVLLCHVQLYIFSSRWQCDDLRDLVLQKLRLTLSKYVVTADRIGEVVTLIRHVYDHTQDYSNGGTDKLRDLMSDFAVCHIRSIEPDEEFRELLTKENQIGRDLIMKLMQQLE